MCNFENHAWDCQCETGQPPKPIYITDTNVVSYNGMYGTMPDDEYVTEIFNNIITESGGLETACERYPYVQMKLNRYGKFEAIDDSYLSPITNFLHILRAERMYNDELRAMNGWGPSGSKPAMQQLREQVQTAHAQNPTYAMQPPTVNANVVRNNPNSIVEGMNVSFDPIIETPRGDVSASQLAIRNGVRRPIPNYAGRGETHVPSNKPMSQNAVFDRKVQEQTEEPQFFFDPQQCVQSGSIYTGNGYGFDESICLMKDDELKDMKVSVGSFEDDEQEQFLKSDFTPDMDKIVMTQEEEDSQGIAFDPNNMVGGMPTKEEAMQHAASVMHPNDPRCYENNSAVAQRPTVPVYGYANQPSMYTGPLYNNGIMVNPAVTTSPVQSTGSNMALPFPNGGNNNPTLGQMFGAQSTNTQGMTAIEQAKAKGIRTMKLSDLVAAKKQRQQNGGLMPGESIDKNGDRTFTLSQAQRDLGMPNFNQAQKNGGGMDKSVFGEFMNTTHTDRMKAPTVSLRVLKAIQATQVLSDGTVIGAEDPRFQAYWEKMTGQKVIDDVNPQKPVEEVKESPPDPKKNMDFIEMVKQNQKAAEEKEKNKKPSLAELRSKHGVISKKHKAEQEAKKKEFERVGSLSLAAMNGYQVFDMDNYQPPKAKKESWYKEYMDDPDFLKRKKHIPDNVDALFVPMMFNPFGNHDWMQATEEEIEAGLSPRVEVVKSDKPEEYFEDIMPKTDKPIIPESSLTSKVLKLTDEEFELEEAGFDYKTLAMDRTVEEADLEDYKLARELGRYNRKLADEFLYFKANGGLEEFMDLKYHCEVQLEKYRSADAFSKVKTEQESDRSKEAMELGIAQERAKMESLRNLSSYEFKDRQEKAIMQSYQEQIDTSKKQLAIAEGKGTITEKIKKLQALSNMKVIPYGADNAYQKAMEMVTAAPPYKADEHQQYMTWKFMMRKMYSNEDEITFNSRFDEWWNAPRAKQPRTKLEKWVSYRKKMFDVAHLHFQFNIHDIDPIARGRAIEEAVRKAWREYDQGSIRPDMTVNEFLDNFGFMWTRRQEEKLEEQMQSVYAHYNPEAFNKYLIEHPIPSFGKPVGPGLGEIIGTKEYNRKRQLFINNIWQKANRGTIT
mgnify:CR=1 FL=1